MGRYKGLLPMALENALREQQFKERKFDKAFVYAAVILVVLAAVFFTVYEMRNPPFTIDSDKEVFVARVEQLLEKEKANLWLGGKTAGELLQQGNWETMDDYRMADVDSVTKDFLGRSAAVSDWDTLKFQEIDRLWQAWSAMDPKPDPEIWLAEAFAELKSQQSLPGLGPNLWMVVTPYNERYILAFADNQWAICPAENLQESA